MVFSVVDVIKVLTQLPDARKAGTYWKVLKSRLSNEVKPGQEFAILTNLIHQEWIGTSIKQHKELRSLKSQTSATT